MCSHVFPSLQAIFTQLVAGNGRTAGAIAPRVTEIDEEAAAAATLDDGIDEHMSAPSPPIVAATVATVNSVAHILSPSSSVPSLVVGTDRGSDDGKEDECLVKF